MHFRTAGQQHGSEAYGRANTPSNRGSFSGIARNGANRGAGGSRLGDSGGILAFSRFAFDLSFFSAEGFLSRAINAAHRASEAPLHSIAKHQSVKAKVQLSFTLDSARPLDLGDRSRHVAALRDYDPVVHRNRKRGLQVDTATSGTLRFQAGETSQTIAVAVLDDSHDEGEETLTLRLSNPVGGRLADGEATGTIENRDPLPRAFMARFGRAVAVQVVEHVEQRIRAPRETGFEGRFAGRELRRGMEREVALSFLNRLGGRAGANRYGAGLDTPMAGSTWVSARWDSAATAS